MGIFSSKKKKKGIPTKVRNAKCNCSMYHRNKHCCLNSCFPNIRDAQTITQMPYMMDGDNWSFLDAHKRSLNDALSTYKSNMDLRNFISVISSFLQASMNEYHVFCHAEMTHYIQTGNLCQIWFDDMIGSEIKIILMGHAGAGKSSLVLRWITNEFVQDPDPTIEDSYRKQIDINGNKVILDILDTAGQQEFASMQDRWIRESKLNLLVFGINDKNALDECIKQFDHIERIQDLKDNTDHFSRIGMMLVGAKCDLMYDPHYKCDNKEKQIMKDNYDTAMQLSKIWNIPFIETSAKEYINVQLLFKQSIYEYWIQTQTKSINWDTTEHRDLVSTKKNV